MAKCIQYKVDATEEAKFYSGCGAGVTPAADTPKKASPQKTRKAPAKNAENNTAPPTVDPAPGIPAGCPAPAGSAIPPFGETPARPSLSSAQKAEKEAPPTPGSRYEPITTKGFIGIIFLMLLPLINLILLLAWAFGGCRKVNKQNFAKAILVWMLIGIGFTIISGLILWIFFPADGLQEIQKSLFQGLIKP